MYQINFGWGYAGGAYIIPPNPLAGIKGTYFWDKGRRGRKKQGEGEERGGEEPQCVSFIFLRITYAYSTNITAAAAAAAATTTTSTNLI